MFFFSERGGRTGAQTNITILIKKNRLPTCPATVDTGKWGISEYLNISADSTKSANPPKYWTSTKTIKKNRAFFVATYTTPMDEKGYGVSKF